MSQERENDALRDAYQRLRSETEGSARVPDFGAMMARAKEEAARPSMAVVAGRGRPRRALVVGGWATVALAAAIAGILLVDSRGGGDEQRFEHLVATYTADAAGGVWTSPTAGLLDVPGMSFTRSMPSVGDPLRDFDPRAVSEPSAPEGRDS